MTAPLRALFGPARQERGPATRPRDLRRAPGARRRVPLVLCAASAWLVFVAAHHALSGRVWWWQLPELVPPLALAAVPVALLGAALAARRARRAAVAVALAALTLGGGASGLNPAALWHRADPAPADAIKVFSWNTWYWDQPVGRQLPPPTGTPPRDVAAFYRYLRAQDADVLLLQEYVYFGADSRPIRVNDLDRLRGEFPGFHIAAASELVTLSRFPIVLERGLDLRPHAPEHAAPVPPGSDWPGFHTVKTLRTDLRVGSRTVSFYNSHINSPVGGSAGGLGLSRLNRAQHEARAANLRALAADIQANPLPAVLAGDFNASPAMGILRLVPERMADATPALRSLYPATWNDRWTLGALWRIDWAYTTQEVAVHEYRLVRSDGLSDHSGQRLVISFSR
ncbi:endonuclease/exonuclease/phosphatase family protein [Nonomuraea zeae]|uniref:endonuclease/exonuclease/phosphatase family protein n=1 Tax=Nonomuraea zeae TaxID=1642303 RepID=UPI001478CD50|nr:endonuclease/exonuclease/phosphatase family protein [Nonomuraea zeae]